MPESSRDEIAKLEALYASNPEGRVFTHLAEAYRKAGELERAQTILEAGLARHPGYASAHVVLGRVLMAMQKPHQAEESFRRVMSLDPHNLIALRSLGDIARAAGRNDEALNYFEELRHYDPNNEEIGQITEELRNSPRAEQVAEPEPVHEPEAASEPASAEAEPWSPASAETAPAEEAERAPWEREPAEATSSEPAEAEPWMSGDEVASDLDLEWVSAAGEEDQEGLPGDLAEFASLAGGGPDLGESEEPSDFGDFGSIDLSAAQEEMPEDDVLELEDFAFDTPAEEAPAEEETAEFAEPMAGTSADSYEPPELLLEPDTAFEPEVSFEPEPSFEAELSFEPEPAIETPEPLPFEALQPAEPETGEVFTETIAELYRAQGLNDRAAEVYRALLNERPDDPELQAKLAEIEAANEPPMLELEEPEPEPAVAWLAGGAGVVENVPTPYAWAEQPRETPDAGPPIAKYFQTLLAWRPSAPPAPVEAEPEEFLMLEEVAEAAPSPAPPQAAEPAPVAPPPVSASPAPPPASAGSEATNAGDAFDAWFGDPDASAEGTTPQSGSGDSGVTGDASMGDDDDLEMFRSWLQSLKK